MDQLSFQNLTFSYPNATVPALSQIDLAIEESAFVVVCGRSGCGKTTLLKQLKKSMTPFGNSSGHVLYNGVAIAALEDRTAVTDIGFVQQSPENQLVTNAVWHELAFGLESLGLPPDIIRKRVAEMSNFFGISPWFHCKTASLSGGQMQLLNLASVMVLQPRVLVLDEPTSQLDPIAAAEFVDMLHKINRELGTTIVISEHRLEELFSLADQVVLMEDGKISQVGTVRQVGQALSQANSPHPMAAALPAPMRVYLRLGQGGDCPVNVREGRLWLSRLLPLPACHTLPAPTAPLLPLQAQVELKNLWFRYDRDGEDIVKGLSLLVRRGTLFCLLGANGTGKTTVLRLMSSTLRPYRGEVFVDGRPLTKARDRRGFGIGVLPQNPLCLFTEITAQEELFDMLALLSLPHGEKLARVEQMLALLELTGCRETHPYDLSGGEQQRLALGKILLPEPQLLLLDEPTKGMDPFFKETFAAILAKLKQAGKTIFMVTHDIEFAAAFADECALFFDGGISSSGAPREFFGGNSFYTTVANRMSRHLFTNAVTCEEVISLCEQNMTPVR